MKAKEFNNSVKAHKLWLHDNNSGKRAVYDKVDFKCIDMTDVDMTDALFNKCTFERVMIDYSTFSNSVFVECKFSRFAIKQSDFKGCEFSRCTLINGVIDASDFDASSMPFTTFKKLDIADTAFEHGYFLECILIDCTFNACDMTNAFFQVALMQNVSFTGCDFTRADFTNAAFYNTTFDEACGIATATDISFCGCTGNGKDIMSINNSAIAITYNLAIIQVGRQRYTISTWAESDDSDGWINKVLDDNNITDSDKRNSFKRYWCHTLQYILSTVDGA